VRVLRIVSELPARPEVPVRSMPILNTWQRDPRSRGGGEMKSLTTAFMMFANVGATRCAFDHGPNSSRALEIRSDEFAVITSSV
jgi:hypothetical protein